MVTCQHIGRIEKDLPCPDPSCAAAASGTKLVVPRTRQAETGWEWAAKHPEKTERILAALGVEHEFGEPYDYQFSNVNRLTDGDAIPVMVYGPMVLWALVGTDGWLR